MMDMTWQEIRQHHPNSWLLLEATRARTEGDERVLEDLSVLERFEDSAVALRAYKTQHDRFPERELHVAHTSKETLEVKERRWLGIRSAA
jgi:hypothetical protein